MKPAVSIIIPTYNRWIDLKNAIKSITNQTFKNWELIIIDDCSTEKINIPSLYDKVKYGHKIKHLTTAKNSGTPVIPRNLGVDNAQADYIAFLDSDDSWEINKLEIQLTDMIRRESILSYHNLKVIKNNIYFTNWNKMSTCHDGMIFPFLLRKNFIPTSSVITWKNTYINYGKMDIRYKVSHDWDLWLKIADNNPIHYINQPLGTLNLHSGSVITDTHKRRSESRDVIRKWKAKISKKEYNKILFYYYFMEIFDLLPENIQNIARKILYKGR